MVVINSMYEKSPSHNRETEEKSLKAILPWTIQITSKRKDLLTYKKKKRARLSCQLSIQELQSNGLEEFNKATSYPSQKRRQKASLVEVEWNIMEVNIRK